MLLLLFDGFFIRNLHPNFRCTVQASSGEQLNFTLGWSDFSQSAAALSGVYSILYPTQFKDKPRSAHMSHTKSKKKEESFSVDHSLCLGEHHEIQ